MCVSVCVCVRARAPHLFFDFGRILRVTHHVLVKNILTVCLTQLLINTCTYDCVDLIVVFSSCLIAISCGFLYCGILLYSGWHIRGSFSLHIYVIHSGSLIISLFVTASATPFVEVVYSVIVLCYYCHFLLFFIVAFLRSHSLIYWYLIIIVPHFSAIADHFLLP